MINMDLELKLDNIDIAAKEFLNALGENKQIAFYGNMGAGKTTFITALCSELKALDLVSSPTFSIVNEYETESGDTIFHFDFYRINEVEELYDIGFEEYIAKDAWCFIEWPEKGESLLNESFIKARIEVSDTEKRILSFDVK